MTRDVARLVNSTAKMIRCQKCIYVFVLLQIFTQNVLLQNATNSDIRPKGIRLEDSDGRRSGGILILDNSGKSSDGQRLTSHKVETKTYTTRVTSGSGGSGGLQGWVSESQNTGDMLLQPQIQGVVQSQQACGSGNNVLSNTGGEAAIVKKKAVSSSQSFNGGGSINSLTSNENQWQSGQNRLKVGSLVVGQLGGPTSIIHGTSQVTTNNVKDIRDTILSGNNRGVNAVYEGADNVQKQGNVFYPDNDSYKVSITSSGDGIYAKELTGQQSQNLNVMVPPEINSPNIVAVPVTRPQLGQFTVQGYRPNIQYYLKQIETSNMLKNPSAILKVPSFIERIKPDQMNINLSEDQLNSYKQYLIQTGLIKLKPYQLIFSDQFRPKLKTLQWMAVPLESNSEYCKQRCGNLFARNTLYSTMTENASKLPIKLLVPVLKIGSGLKKTVTGVQNVAGGVGDISDGMFRMMKDSPSHVAGLVKENTDDTKNQS